MKINYIMHVSSGSEIMVVPVKGDGSGNQYHDRWGKFTFAPADAKKAAKVSSSISKGAKETSNSLRSANQRKNGPRPRSERIDLSDVSDKELQQILNRERMEREYDIYFNTPQETKGERFVNGLGTFLSYAAAAAAIASAGFTIYATLKGNDVKGG